MVVFTLAADYNKCKEESNLTFPSPEVEFHHETHGHAVVMV